jgi:hypothetical protein
MYEESKQDRGMLIRASETAHSGYIVQIEKATLKGRRHAMTSTCFIGFAAAVLLTIASPSSATESTEAPAPSPSLSATVPLSSFSHTGILRPGPATRLRIQPCRSDPLVYARRRARSHLRHVLLGDRTCLWPARQRSNGLGKRSRRLCGGAKSAGAQVPRHGA